MIDRTPPNTSPPKPGEVNIDQADPNFSAEEPQALLARVKNRFEMGTGAFEENRRMHSEDLNFVYNSEASGQWDPTVLEARKGKPCYTFNRVLQPVNLVVADMRQTQPAVKVRPSRGPAEEAVADVMAGMLRSIQEDSRASVIHKTQYKFAVAGGFGAWRVMPQYAGDDTFDQVLRIRDIPNPQTVVWDPEANDPTAGDAMWCVIGERISTERFQAEHPTAEHDFTSFYISRDNYGWYTDKEVRVVEYFERVPFKKTIAELDDGRVIDYDATARRVEKELKEAEDAGGRKIGARVKRTREVLKWRVMWVKCNGGEILEGPIYYDWKRIPVVRCPGRYINIEGRKKLQSLIRHSKDAQRSYNSRVSDMIERAALLPKAPYLVTETMVKGYEDIWAQANTASRPYLPYNVDPKSAANGGAPERVAPIDMPAAALALAQAAASDIQATIGYFDPALGNADDMNRVSGKALVQHTRRSDLGSFEFIDGYGDALQLEADMCLDMIPTVYDAPRVERIIGHDGIEKMVQLYGDNPNDPQAILNDLKKGTYSCTVTLGPSYQTARQEMLETLINAAEVMPVISQLAPDLLAKQLDTPEVDELVRRLRIGLIRQGVVQPTEEEKKQMPPPPPPDPLKQAEVERMQALAARDGAQAQITQHKAQMIPEEDRKHIYEVAGKHLANLLMVKKLNEPQEAGPESAAAA